MDIENSLKRMQTSMALDKSLMTTTMAILARRDDPKPLETLKEIKTGYQQLLKSILSDEQLVTEQMIREKLADVEDWIARALENCGQLHKAAEAFEHAAVLFEAVDKQTNANQARDNAGALKLDLDADFDEEIERLQERLDATPDGSLERIQVLVALGELYSKADDDFEALKYLELAEVELNKLGGHPSDNEILRGLNNTVADINSGKEVAGFSAIETNLKRRALTQRLYLALANAYRVTNPKLAEKYEALLKKLDSGKDTSMSDLIGKYLDCDQNVSKFLANLPKEYKN